MADNAGRVGDELSEAAPRHGAPQHKETTAMAVFRYTRVRVHNPAAKKAAKAKAREVKLAERVERNADQVKPLPTSLCAATWIVVGVLSVVLLVVHPPAGLAFAAVMSIGVVKLRARFNHRVQLNRARWLAAGVDPDTGQPLTNRYATGFEGMAATYDQQGMPESAKAYRDLAED